MNMQATGYSMMAIGTVSALVIASGPLGESVAFQVAFGGALLLLASGALVRHGGARKEALAGTTGGEVARANAALITLRDALEQTLIECDAIDETHRFHDRLEQATQPPIQEFLRHRQALLDACGFGPFAEVMIRYAFVERTINRALSASADGNRQEANNCLRLAAESAKRCTVG